MKRHKCTLLVVIKWYLLTNGVAILIVIIKCAHYSSDWRTTIKLHNVITNMYIVVRYVSLNQRRLHAIRRSDSNLNAIIYRPHYCAAVAIWLNKNNIIFVFLGICINMLNVLTAYNSVFIMKHALPLQSHMPQACHRRTRNALQHWIGKYINIVEQQVQT